MRLVMRPDNLSQAQMVEVLSSQNKSEGYCRLLSGVPWNIVRDIEGTNPLKQYSSAEVPPFFTSYAGAEYLHPSDYTSVYCNDTLEDTFNLQNQDDMDEAFGCDDVAQQWTLKFLHEHKDWVPLLRAMFTNQVEMERIFALMSVYLSKVYSKEHLKRLEILRGVLEGQMTFAEICATAVKYINAPRHVLKYIGKKNILQNCLRLLCFTRHIYLPRIFESMADYNQLFKGEIGWYPNMWDKQYFYITFYDPEVMHMFHERQIQITPATMKLVIQEANLKLTDNRTLSNITRIGQHSPLMHQFMSHMDRNWPYKPSKHTEAARKASTIYGAILKETGYVCDYEVFKSIVDVLFRPELVFSPEAHAHFNFAEFKPTIQVIFIKFL
jgi:hypothetical protein